MPISYLLSYELSFVTKTFLNSPPFFFFAVFYNFSIAKPFRAHREQERNAHI